MDESSHLDFFLVSHSFNNKKEKSTSINQPHRTLEEEIYMLQTQVSEEIGSLHFKVSFS